MITTRPTLSDIFHRILLRSSHTMSMAEERRAQASRIQLFKHRAKLAGFSDNEINEFIQNSSLMG